MQYLPATEENAYLQRINSLGAQYQRGLAKNVFQRDQVGLDYGIAKTGLVNQWTAAREQLPGQYQARGVFNSGIYQGALADYAKGRMWAFDALQRQNDRQLGGIMQSDLDLDTAYTTGLQDIESQRAARRQELASALRAGGYV